LQSVAVAESYRTEGRVENRRPSPNAKSLANLRPVQPGQVLNPGGRPKIPAEVREAAMALTPKAIETLGKIMEDERVPPGVRVTACERILDRALGKPAQTVDVTTRKDDALDYSIADLVAIAYRRGLEGGSVDGEAAEAVGVNVGAQTAGNPETLDIPKG
jgi:hypothetical protein